VNGNSFIRRPAPDNTSLTLNVSWPALDRRSGASQAPRQPTMAGRERYRSAYGFVTGRIPGPRRAFLLLQIAIKLRSSSQY
jgi:hypothetical protein